MSGSICDIAILVNIGVPPHTTMSASATATGSHGWSAKRVSVWGGEAACTGLLGMPSGLVWDGDCSSPRLSARPNARAAHQAYHVATQPTTARYP